MKNQYIMFAVAVDQLVNCPRGVRPRARRHSVSVCQVVGSPSNLAVGIQCCTQWFLIIRVILEICIFGHGQEFELIIVLFQTPVQETAPPLQKISVGSTSSSTLSSPTHLSNNSTDSSTTTSLLTSPTSSPTSHYTINAPQMHASLHSEFVHSVRMPLVTFLPIYLHASNQTHSDSFILG